MGCSYRLDLGSWALLCLLQAAAIAMCFRQPCNILAGGCHDEGLGCSRHEDLRNALLTFSADLLPQYTNQRHDTLPQGIGKIMHRWRMSR
jgi:hypothetical protein